MLLFWCRCLIESAQIRLPWILTLAMFFAVTYHLRYLLNLVSAPSDVRECDLFNDSLFFSRLFYFEGFHL